MVDGADLAPAAVAALRSRRGSRGRARRATPASASPRASSSGDAARRWRQGATIAGALARQHVLVDPAFGAVDVADFPPGVEFLDDFDRRAGDFSRPRRRRILVPGPTRTLIGRRAGGDEARQRQAAGLSAAAATAAASAPSGETRAMSTSAEQRQRVRRAHSEDAWSRLGRTSLCRGALFSYH